MNDIRITHNIESAVNERRNGVHYLQEYHSGSTDEYLIRQRAELQEILRALDVRDRQFTVPMISELPSQIACTKTRSFELDTPPTIPGDNSFIVA